jgi:hypothetical protein
MKKQTCEFIENRPEWCNVTPAVEQANGTKSWYANGEFHHILDGPIVEYPDRDKAWYKSLNKPN